jgi:glycosyltransferase involved in cell wall biosynthesis
VNLLHWMKKERSGLAFSTLELVKYEERQGHTVCIRQPQDEAPIYGRDDQIDVHCIHSQLGMKAYHDGKPKFMWMHGEPLSSVGNGVSMKAIVDLATTCDAFLCMREDEHVIWKSIKRTYLVPKGIDLDQFRPLPGPTEKLSGEPAVLYVENWRGQRNPLYACVAMQEVFKRFPKARLHLYNCTNKQMQETFAALIKNNKWWPFIRSLSGPVNDINLLLNRVDIVVSGLFPLYARGIEAFGAGKAYIGAGYREHGYPYTCDLEPRSMAAAIIKCWEEWGKVDFRNWAETYHDVNETVKQSVEIYGRYL